MTYFTRNFLALALLLLMSVPSVAFADAASAQVFYENAAKEYGKGNYGAAAELLYKAYVNDANLIYAYNRILALQADKQYAAALKELNVFEKQMLKDPEKRFEDVPQIKSKLEDQVSASAAAKVTDPVVKKNPDIAVNPIPDSQVEGDPDVISSPSPSAGASTGEVLGLTVAGLGLIPLTGGILFSTGIFTSEKYQSLARDHKTPNVIDKYSPEGKICDVDPGVSCSKVLDEFEQDKAEADDHLTYGIIGIATGAAMIIGGGILYLVSGDSSDEDANASNFSISPYITPTSAGAGFTLDF